MPNVLTIEPFMPEAFAPFGEVISAAAASRQFPINDGTTQRFHEISRTDCEREDGHTGISLCRAQPRALPFVVTMLERHPLGSQAFVPLSKTPYLIVVSESPQHAPRCFLAREGEGVNYRRGVWHHPLLALEQESEFLIVDRLGTAPNCEEATLPQAWIIPMR